MTENKTYNGWTNYETWLVKLWMDNEEPSYLYWKDAAQECFDTPVENQYMELDRRRVHALAERLKDEHESALEEAIGSTSGWIHDLASGALSEVNWYEIAVCYLVEVVAKSEEADSTLL